MYGKKEVFYRSKYLRNNECTNIWKEICAEEMKYKMNGGSNVTEGNIRGRMYRGTFRRKRVQKKRLQKEGGGREGNTKANVYKEISLIYTHEASRGEKKRRESTPQIF